MPLRFLCRALQLAIMDVLHTAPSGGSAPDDFVTQGRPSHNSKRGGSAPAGATLPHGSSADTTVHVPELGAQAAAPPSSDKLTALAEQIANMKAEADAAQANSFRKLEQMTAMFHHVVSQLPAPAATPVPAAEPPAAPQRRRRRCTSRRSRTQSSDSTRRPPSTRPCRGGRRAGHRGARRGGIATAVCGQLLVCSGATGTGRFSGAGSAAASAADAARIFLRALAFDQPSGARQERHPEHVKCIKIDLVPAGMNTQADDGYRCPSTPDQAGRRTTRGRTVGRSHSVR